MSDAKVDVAWIRREAHAALARAEQRIADLQRERDDLVNRALLTTKALMREHGQERADRVRSARYVARLERAARAVVDAGWNWDKRSATLPVLAAVLDRMSDFTPEPERERILGQVRGEREEQDRKWGGHAHDDTHTPADWIALITRHAGLAVDHCPTVQARDGAFTATYRKQLVRVAALAVCALEASARTDAAPIGTAR